MSTGETLRVRAAMKPISTIPRALATVDTATGEAAVAHHQRSDVCAVPAAGIVAEAMAALMRGHVPFVESFGDERVVTKRVPCDIELLLLLAGAVGESLDRTALGKACKYPPPRVSEALRRLSDDRYAHQTRDRRYYITGPGERFLAERVAA